MKKEFSKFLIFVAGLGLGASACSRTAIDFEGRRVSTPDRIQNERNDSGVIGALDSGIQTGMTDAGTKPKMFQVTVYDQGRPIPGVQIAFHSPDGSFESLLTTDSTGTVEYNITAEGMMTVIFTADPRDPNQQTNLFSYTELQPGEHIHVGRRTTESPERPLQVALELENTPRNVDRLVVDFGCSEPFEAFPGQTTTFDISSRCLDDNGKLNVMVQAEPNGRGSPWFTYATDQNVQGGRSTEIQLDNWTQGNQTLSIDLDGNTPGNLFSFVELYSQRAGKLYRTSGGGNGGFGLIRTRFPADFGETFLFRTGYAYELSGQQNNEPSGYLFTEDRFELVEELRLNPTDTFLAPISEVNARKEGRDQRITFNFEKVGSGVKPDGYIARIRLGTENNRPVFWSAILSPELDSTFVFPELPANSFNLGSAFNDSVRAAQIIGIDRSYVQGFDDLRQNHGATIFENEQREQTPSRFVVGGDLNF